MSSKLNRASALAVAATMFATLIGADGSGAIAEALQPAVIKSEPATQFTAQPVIQQLPEEQLDVDPAVQDDSVPISEDLLARLVSETPMPEDMSRELNCLAGAIYFEAKSESLPGQLAVGRVVIARSKSGRFPNSYCGVVFQPSQFSFVRGGAMPHINKKSRDWREAVAIAQIAHEGKWRSPVEGALYFHAARVSPGWRLTRIAQVDHHIFYR